MKLVGIVGSNAPKSYNRMLLQFIRKHYKEYIELDIVEITNVPIFNQSDDQTESELIQGIAKRIESAQGVIIATPEHNHTIPAALKSLIEWLSYKIHPFENKPVMIVGASYFSQGSSRAQMSLRVILDSPGVNAVVLPGNEFLLGNVKEAFDSDGNLKDHGTVNFLTACLENFLRFIQVVSQLNFKDTTKLIDLVSEVPVPPVNDQVDAVSGASEKEDTTASAEVAHKHADVVSGASQKAEVTPKVDATTGATQKITANRQADVVSAASQRAAQSQTLPQSKVDVTSAASEKVNHQADVVSAASQRRREAENPPQIETDTVTGASSQSNKRR